MFTGAKPDDIIRRAAERAAAKEPPLTFLGREGSISMAREVGACLPRLRSELDGDASYFKSIVQAAAAYALENRKLTSVSVEDILSSKPAKGVDEDDALTLFTGTHFMLSTAVRQKTRIGDVKKHLEALRVTAAFAKPFIAALSKWRESMEDAANGDRIRHPHLDGLKWRCDVTISSDRLKRVLRPCVAMQMTLSDGAIKSFEVPIEQFHALRYNVAKVLQHMQELEAHPMMRIMAALEEEERKKMQKQ